MLEGCSSTGSKEEIFVYLCPVFRSRIELALDLQQSIRLGREDPKQLGNLSVGAVSQKPA